MSGVVLDSGDGTTHAVPIYDGVVDTQAIQRISLGGREVSDVLAKLLFQDNKYQLFSTANREIAREIKEKIGYVALEYEKELKEYNNTSMNATYELPDGKIINVGSERFKCTEVLFHPSLVQVQEPGLHELLYNSITKCDPEIRKYLFQNIILTGGSTSCPGFRERIQKDVSSLAIGSEVFVTSSPIYSAWIGGSVLASLPLFRSMWVTKREYYEYGSDIIYKCF